MSRMVALIAVLCLGTAAFAAPSVSIVNVTVDTAGDLFGTGIPGMGSLSFDVQYNQGDGPAITNAMTVGMQAGVELLGAPAGIVSLPTAYGSLQENLTATMVQNSLLSGSNMKNAATGTLFPSVPGGVFPWSTSATYYVTSGGSGTGHHTASGPATSASNSHIDAAGPPSGTDPLGIGDITFGYVDDRPTLVPGSPPTAGGILNTAVPNGAIIAHFDFLYNGNLAPAGVARIFLSADATFAQSPYLVETDGTKVLLSAPSADIQLAAPEPATMSLLGLGLAGLVMRRKKK